MIDRGRKSGETNRNYRIEWSTNEGERPIFSWNVQWNRIELLLQCKVIRTRIFKTGVCRTLFKHNRPKFVQKIQNGQISESLKKHCKLAEYSIQSNKPFSSDSDSSRHGQVLNAIHTNCISIQTVDDQFNSIEPKIACEYKIINVAINEWNAL